jgi:predicted metal-dependent phosphotriesterase family hydrolase
MASFAGNQATSMIMSVTGPVAVDQLGVTLMHEHLLINQVREQRRTGLVNDFEALLAELVTFRANGGQTVVDLTSGELSAGAASDPGQRYTKNGGSGASSRHTRGPAHVQELRRLSEQSGVRLIAGTGHYRDPYLDNRWFDEHSVDEIAELLVRDLDEGFPGTTVRAGVIGEIGSDKWYVSAAEERSFRAAARASIRTGVVISTHAARWPVGLDQLAILTSEGVDPSQVVVGHCDSVPIPEYHRDVARSGAWLQFDGIRSSSGHDFARRVRWVLDLCREGFVSRLLLSHDVCTTEDLSRNGGCGFTLVPGAFRQALLDGGLSTEECDQLLVHNPAAALEGSSAV